MGLPQDHEAGYLAGSAVEYVGNLRGRLMLYFGTADDNVHPSNSMELIAALRQAGKRPGRALRCRLGPTGGMVP